MNNITSVVVFFCLLSSMPLRAEVSEQPITYKMYDAHYQSGQTLLAALSSVSPVRENGKVYIGYTEWSITWKFKMSEQQNNTCSISSINTNITTQISLPNLISTDDAAISQFKLFIIALRAHELGHFKNGANAAHEIDQKILYFQNMKDCHYLELAANQAAHEIVKKYRLRDKDYDLVTGHGKSQGAWLPN